MNSCVYWATREGSSRRPAMRRASMPPCRRHTRAWPLRTSPLAACREQASLACRHTQTLSFLR